MVRNFSQNQVERLLDLVPYLSVNPGVSLEKIAKDFGVTKAGVLDDLNTLWMCGLPGYTPLELIDLSFDTGYVSIRNADVLSKPRKLSSTELAALIVGLCILRESIDDSNFHYSAIGELVNRLTSVSKIPVPVSLASVVNPDIRLITTQAMKTQHNLTILYHSFTKDVESERKIFPLGFQFIDGKEYLESYCYESKDFRLFRLDRVKKAQMADEHQDIVRNVKNESSLRKFSINVVSNPRKVSETFDLKLNSEMSPFNQFSTTAFSDEWILRTVCSLNSSAILCEPSDLRESLSTRVNKALKLYQ